MFRLDARRMKSQCWASRWRGVGNDGTGRPTHYVPLTQLEMAQVAATGRIQIADWAIPEIVVTQRDRMNEMAEEMGIDLDGTDLAIEDNLARLALEELAAA